MNLLRACIYPFDSWWKMKIAIIWVSYLPRAHNYHRSSNVPYITNVNWHWRALHTHKKEVGIERKREKLFSWKPLKSINRRLECICMTIYHTGKCGIEPFCILFEKKNRLKIQNAIESISSSWRSNGSIIFREKIPRDAEWASRRERERERERMWESEIKTQNREKNEWHMIGRWKQ